MDSALGYNGSPGEIRTLVSGSRAQSLPESILIEDIDKTVSDFWDYCKVVERLSKKVSKDYKNVARRFLRHSKGEVSRQAIREFLKLYLEKAPRTYKEFLDVLDVNAEHKIARNKSHLLKILEQTRCPYIHISAHGSKDGIVTVNDIIGLRKRRKGKRRAKIVFCSACQTGSTRLAEALQESMCKEYLAPKRDIYWTEVALTSLILYHALFHDKLTLSGAINRAFKKFQAKGDWYIYTE